MKTDERRHRLTRKHLRSRMSLRQLSRRRCSCPCAARRALLLVSWLAHLPRWVLEGMTGGDSQQGIDRGSPGEAISWISFVAETDYCVSPPRKLNVFWRRRVLVCAQLSVFSLRPENLSSRVDLQFHAGSALDNPLTLTFDLPTSGSTYGERPPCAVCLSSFVLIAQAVLLLERGHTHRQTKSRTQLIAIIPALGYRQPG